MIGFINHFEELETDNFLFKGFSLESFFEMARLEGAHVHYISGDKCIKVDKIAGKVICSGFSTYVFNNDSNFFYSTEEHKKLP